jgi:hypothetical protein
VVRMRDDFPLDAFLSQLMKLTLHGARRIEHVLPARLSEQDPESGASSSTADDTDSAQGLNLTSEIWNKILQCEEPERSTHW